MGGRAPLSKLDCTGSYGARLRPPTSPPPPPPGGLLHCRGSLLFFRRSASCDRPTKKKTVLLREIESALRAKRLCAREPYIKSTAMRVISRAGDFEARPLKRMLWKAEIGRRPSLAGIQVW